IILAGDATADIVPGSIFSIQGYHLSPTSPVIDKGGYTSRMGGVDIDGQPRMQDGDFDGNAVVDIGADELQPDSSAAPLRVTRPTEGQLCIVGDTTTIEWSAPATDSVDLLYTVDYDSSAGAAVWMFIDSGVPADTPGYLWRIPAALSPRCRVMVVDAADSSRHAMSAPFRIKGYVLTRLADDSTYIPFLPYQDGWSIPNDSADMWPESWYRRFDYDTATDPFTGMPYPAFFGYAPINARPEDFPSWPTYVRAFGSDQCYLRLTDIPLYFPQAVLKWAAVKRHWHGSCAGFCLTGLQAFEDSAVFADSFPEVGNFDTLYALPLSDNRREVINLMWTRILGDTHRNYLAEHLEQTVAETIRELRTTLLADSLPHAYLYLADTADSAGAHAVVPYLIMHDTSQAGLLRVYVYDPNAPGDAQRFITVDTITGNWEYAPFNWHNNRLLILLDPAEDYLNTSPLPTSPHNTLPAATADIEYAVLVPSGDCYFNVTTSSGDSLGWAGGAVFNTIPNAVPLLLPAGPGTGPDAYFLPEQPSEISISPTATEPPHLFAFLDTLVYGAGRQDGGKLTVHLDNGISYIHTDSTPGTA
ncbi:MAG: hypothetical protein D6800_13845, partial [Candidatus Zixiibacteriota bacterium]